MMSDLYTTGRGYEEIRRPGREGANDAIKHHRLLAYAWGLIDRMDDLRDIDHRVEIGWLNIEGNIRPTPPSENYRRARRREYERRRSPADYCAADTAEVFEA